MQPEATMQEFLANLPEPRFLVLFPHIDQTWGMLNAATGAIAAMALRDDKSQSAAWLPPRVEGAAAVKIYERIGVAAMDLDAVARASLEANGALVIENRVMRLPSFVSSDIAAALAVQPMTWALSAVGITPNTIADGSGIRVAVLDTGIDLNHQDFVGRLSPIDLKSFVPGAATVQDGNGHGTHCAGVVGALVPAGGSRYSVAPGCTLLIGKVLSDFGSGYTKWIVDGLTWAALDMHAHIVSMSLGSNRQRDKPYEQFYETLAARFLGLGTLIVAAAGNDSARPANVAPIGDPAACPSIVAVAAVDSTQTVADFSCGGDTVKEPDCSGPGVDVYSAWKGGAYNTISGTSMATPHTAGIAALHAQTSGDRGAALRTRLLATATPLGPSSDYGRGLVHAP